MNWRVEWQTDGLRAERWRGADLAKRGRELLIAAALFCLLLPQASTFSFSEGEIPLAGVAFATADAAYTAYKNGNYVTAADKARDAIKLRPDVVRLRLLLIDAVAAQGKLEDADAIATEALSAFKDNAQIIERQSNVREQIANRIKTEAFNIADKGFKEYNDKDYANAISDARKAIELDPTKPAYRALLVNSLIASDDLDQAEKEADDGLAKFNDDPQLLDGKRVIADHRTAKIAAQAFAAADAAYKAFAKKDYAAAVQNAQEAVNLEPDNRAYQELLVRAQKTLKHPPAAMSPGAALAQRGYRDQSRGDSGAAVSDFSAALKRGLPNRVQTRNVQLALADSQMVMGDADGVLDTLSTVRDSPQYDIAARRGAALQSLKRPQEALASYTTAYDAARTPLERASALSSEVILLVSLDKKPEARLRFDTAVANDELSPLPPAEVASLAVLVGNGEVASIYYAQAKQIGQLRGRANLDAGYTAVHQRRNAEAVDYFKRAIDEHDAGALPMDPQELYSVRREVAELTRTWGAFAALTYSKTGAGPGTPFGSASAGGNTLQPGLELYWRPFGNQDGRYVDVFFRMFETLAADNGPTGWNTTQGMYGLRFKPLTDINIVFEVAHAFPAGNLARDDLLLRTAFFYGQGTDLRVDTWTWPTWQIYADYNHFVESTENTASADLRIGQSYRLDQISRNLVFFPHIGFFANYDDKLATAGAYAAGPGVTFRYWFREDKYTAPMSYVDLTAQYRFRLGGDRRAEGPFGQVLLSY
ncbi:MAG TPA: tetratricopeptide repeat protein [Xanthobacteraceae bacterium]|nr:tetratricopeptide repeat protein [Xanthobacteraceae bacterium]